MPLEVSPTASLSLNQYGSDNLVFGIPTNAALEKYTEHTNFFLLPGQSSVENRKPLGGEPGNFRESGSADARRTTRYGVIAVIPGHAQVITSDSADGTANGVARDLSHFATQPGRIRESMEERGAAGSFRGGSEGGVRRWPDQDGKFNRVSPDSLSH